MTAGITQGQKLMTDNVIIDTNDIKIEAPWQDGMAASTLFKVEVDAHGGELDGLLFPLKTAQYKLQAKTDDAASTTYTSDDKISVGKPFTEIEFLSASTNKDDENLLYFKFKAETTCLEANKCQLVVEFPTYDLLYTSDTYFFEELGSIEGLAKEQSSPEQGEFAIKGVPQTSQEYYCALYDNADVYLPDSWCEIRKGRSDSTYLSYPINTRVIFHLDKDITAADVITIGIAMKNRNVLENFDLKLYTQEWDETSSPPPVGIWKVLDQNWYKNAYTTSVDAVSTTDESNWPVVTPDNTQQQDSTHTWDFSVNPGANAEDQVDARTGGKAGWFVFKYRTDRYQPKDGMTITQPAPALGTPYEVIHIKKIGWLAFIPASTDLVDNNVNNIITVQQAQNMYFVADPAHTVDDAVDQFCWYGWSSNSGIMKTKYRFSGSYSAWKPSTITNVVLTTSGQHADGTVGINEYAEYSVAFHTTNDVPINGAVQIEWPADFTMNDDVPGGFICTLTKTNAGPQPQSSCHVDFANRQWEVQGFLEKCVLPCQLAVTGKLKSPSTASSLSFNVVITTFWGVPDTFVNSGLSAYERKVDEITQSLSLTVQAGPTTAPNVLKKPDELFIMPQRQTTHTLTRSTQEQPFVFSMQLRTQMNAFETDSGASYFEITVDTGHFTKTGTHGAIDNCRVTYRAMDESEIHAGTKCDFSVDGTWQLWPPMSTPLGITNNLATSKNYEVTVYSSGLKTDTDLEGIAFPDYTANTFVTFDLKQHPDPTTIPFEGFYWKYEVIPAKGAMKLKSFPFSNTELIAFNILEVEIDTDWTAYEDIATPANRNWMSFELTTGNTGTPGATKF